MVDKPGATDRLVSRAELAGLAGVKRPTITTWEKRHQDFPQPVHATDGDFFTLASAIIWLDRRPIPAKERSVGEPAGFTYGQRVRRRSFTTDDSPPTSSESSDGARTEQILDQLLGPLATKVRGGVGSQVDYLTLLTCLVFLRGCAAQHWSELREIAGSHAEGNPPGRLIRHIGHLTDQALRLHGIVPGVQGTLDRLRPRSIADLVEVIGLCDELGANAFGPLLGRFAAEARLTSADFFTPDDVALLMASLAVKDSNTDCPVYDPYLRGGELLRAASLVRRTSDPLSVQGQSPNRDTLRLAGMNLTLHGQRAALRLGGSTPWDDLDRSHPTADAVVLNPPFNARGALPRKRPDNRWLFGPPPPHNDNYAWLQHAIASLAPGGTATVLMPHQAAVTSDEQEYKIRREMVEQGAVDAIVALPPQLFPSTDAAVTLWILHRPTGSRGQILFIDARQMSIRTRTGQSLAPDAGELISRLYKRRHRLAEGDLEQLPGGGLAFLAGSDALHRTNYSLNPSDYMPGSTGISLHTPSGRAADSLHELVDLRAHVNRLDARIEKLRPLPREGFSGDLPSGWSRLPLAQLCDVQAGPSYARLGIEERAEHGSVPIVMPRHLRNRSVHAADAQRTTDEMARRLAKFRLCVNDMLCVRSGAMSEPALVEEQQEGWLFGANLLRLRLTSSDMADSRYLLGFLCLPAVLGWIRSRSSGTTIPFITARTLGHLMVTLPPLSEQRHIGSALLAFDEQITAHQEFARTAANARTTLAEHLMQGALTLR